jgi:hypothetical protein
VNVIKLVITVGLVITLGRTHNGTVWAGRKAQIRGLGRDTDLIIASLDARNGRLSTNANCYGVTDNAAVDLAGIASPLEASVYCFN